MSDTEVVHLLEDLENIVHLIDNGRDMMKLGGTALLKRIFESSSSTVRKYTAVVLGAALQKYVCDNFMLVANFAL